MSSLQFSDTSKNKPVYLKSMWTMQRYPSVFKLCLGASPANERSPSWTAAQGFPGFVVSSPKYVTSCFSDHVIKFLMSKDNSGRTVDHRRSCFKVNCNCPSFLAAGWVNFFLGKLGVVFNNIGLLHDSNPVAHPWVKNISNLFEKNRLVGRLCLHMHYHRFFVKFSKLVSLLRCSIENSADLSVIFKYTLVRDAVFFAVNFFTGDRASDLRLLLTNQVFRIKGRKSLFAKLNLHLDFTGRYT